MYLPKINQQPNQTKALAFMQKYSFATLVTIIDSKPFATHLPLVISEHNGKIKIEGHFAKSNPQWQNMAEQEILVMFAEPHAYVSTSLYEAEQNVPTWNYIAVHAYGKAKVYGFKDNKEELENIIIATIKTFEEGYLEQYNALSDKYKYGMMSAVVGFEIDVTTLQAKDKLSQNKTPKDQESVANELAKSKDRVIAEVGEAMQERLSK